MDALNIAAAGMTAAATRFEASAARTVRGDADLAAETVEQVSDKAAFEASAAVARASEEMTRRLLDLKV